MTLIESIDKYLTNRIKKCRELKEIRERNYNCRAIYTQIQN
jgi:hypothetical protein